MLDGPIVVTGGAGYIGSRLVPVLLDLGAHVRVLDSLLFGDGGLAALRGNPRLDVFEGDIRDESAVREVLAGATAVVHLAAMSNDPSAELDEAVTRQVNLTAVSMLGRLAKESGVRRIVNASSASVYGVSELSEVGESAPIAPITLYAECKAQSEGVLLALNDGQFEVVSLRAATVCGWSPRQRFDLTLNIFTFQAMCEGRISVFGGEQLRPNIAIGDLVRAYVAALTAPGHAVAGEAFNVGDFNRSVRDLATLVRDEVRQDVPIVIVEQIDHRSYSLSSRKIIRQLGFRPLTGIGAAVRELADAISDGRITDPSADIHRNVLFLKDRPIRTWL